MIFDPKNPYPLLPLDSYTYAEAQTHSVFVDEWLGFECSRVEEVIRGLPKEASQQNWEHLSLQAFQTPYAEIHNILNLLDLKDGHRVVDLGCAYARMAFVMEKHFPQCTFAGFELETLRAQEARRVFLKHTGKEVSVTAQDLSAEDFTPPIADVYFIFDFGSQKSVEKTLLDLKKIAQQNPITVVGRGKLSRFCIHKDHPWLAEINPPQHFPQFSIYRS